MTEQRITGIAYNGTEYVPKPDYDALAARLADLLKFLDGQPKDLESWFTAQGSSPDTCGLTAEARAYEKGWAEGVMQAYGYILDRIRAADSAPVCNGKCRGSPSEFAPNSGWSPDPGCPKHSPAV